MQLESRFRDRNGFQRKAKPAATHPAATAISVLQATKAAAPVKVDAGALVAGATVVALEVLLTAPVLLTVPDGLTETGAVEEWT